MPRDLFSSSSSDSPSPKELSLVASPESQTPTPTAIAQGFGHDGGNSDDDPQLESESPGWENEDGSSGGRNHFLIRHEDSMRGTASQLLRGRGAQQANGVDDLHPFVQTMSLVDLESCLALENACFEEHERESRKTFTYRLTTAPELSLGLFSSVPPPNTPSHMPTYAYALPSDSNNPQKKAVLIGMIIATKTTTPVATDAAMSIPAGWQAPPSTHQHPAQDNREQSQQQSQTSTSTSTTTPTEPAGHNQQGRTIVIWSLAISPSHQGKGLGKVLLKSYQQRMETSGIADRISLLARRSGPAAREEKGEEEAPDSSTGSGSRSKRGQLVEMYKGFGFEETGDSEVVFAGGGWKDMVYDFAGPGKEGSVGGMMGG